MPGERGTEQEIRDAGALAEQLSLRGYDAVHLAFARLVDDQDLVLAAADKSLITAASALGIATADLTHQP